MRLGKRTARLVREAAVAGFVNGSRWGAGRSLREAEEAFPDDSVIVANAQRTARKFSDIYPLLSKVESVDLAADAALAAMEADRMAMLKALINGSSGGSQ